MQIRLAAQVASKVEGIRQSLNYSKLSDIVNLLLDAIRHQWNLNLSYQPKIEANNLKVRLNKRHQLWVSQYAIERGINVTSATNLLISEYLAGNTINSSPQTPINVTESVKPTPQEPRQELDIENLKG